MCSFDTVIHPCPVLADWVRLDQTRADCAGEHRCESFMACPLESHFADAFAPPPEPRKTADLREWCEV